MKTISKYMAICVCVRERERERITIKSRERHKSIGSYYDIINTTEFRKVLIITSLILQSS